MSVPSFPMPLLTSKAVNSDRFHPSQMTSLSNVADLISLFECPVCLEHISPPILQCSNSHLICKTCHQTLSEPRKCPTCRQLMPAVAIRNIPMEKMAIISRLTFPCKYKNNGCLVSRELMDKSIHEEFCDHRPYHCPEFPPDDLIPMCRWSGPAKLVADHLSNAHKIPVNCLTSKLDLSFDDLDINVEYCRWEALISHKTHHFVFVLAKEIDCFNVILAFIGEQRLADQFRYTLELILDADGTGIRFKGVPKSSRRSIPSLLFDVNGLHFNTKIAKHCLDRKRFDISIQISKA